MLTFNSFSDFFNLKFFKLCLHSENSNAHKLYKDHCDDLRGHFREHKNILTNIRKSLKNVLVI